MDVLLGRISRHPARRLFLAAPALAVAACLPTQANPLYCDETTACTDPVRTYCDLAGDYGDHVGHRCIEPPSVDAGTTCQNSSECTTADHPICDSISHSCEPCDDQGSGDTDCAALEADTPLCRDDGVCVECRNAGDCPAESPVCGTDGHCHLCAQHSECASEVCDTESGACVDEWNIVYVDGGGTDSSTCGGPSNPCATIGGSDGGLAKVTGARDTIKVRSGTYRESVAIDGGQTVTLVGPATLSAPSLDNSPAVLVTSGSAVTLDGLSLSNGSGGSDADGVRCTSASIEMLGVTISGNQGAGVDASDCTVTVRDSTISSNDDGGASCSAGELTIEQTTIRANGGGGVEIAGAPFTLRNNFIVQNGGSSTPYGGLTIDNPTSASPQVFEFNTVAASEAQAGAQAAGVYCQVTTALTANSNIVYPTIGGAPAVAGNCAWSYSDIEGGPTGTGNLDVDPEYVDSDNGNFHLKTTSPCKNTADPAASLAIDVDGDPRPQGGRSDMGADEIPE